MTEIACLRPSSYHLYTTYLNKYSLYNTVKQCAFRIQWLRSLLSKCPKYSALINVYTFQFQRNALYRLKNKERDCRNKNRTTATVHNSFP